MEVHTFNHCYVRFRHGTNYSQKRLGDLHMPPGWIVLLVLLVPMCAKDSLVTSQHRFHMSNRRTKHLQLWVVLEHVSIYVSRDHPSLAVSCELTLQQGRVHQRCFGLRTLNSPHLLLVISKHVASKMRF